MAKDLHTVAVSAASSPLAADDRLHVTLQKQVAFPAGGGAGAGVTVNVTKLQLPPVYAVFVNGISQDATSFVTNRTQTGFTVTVNPRLAANTLGAGTFDLLVLA